jgi:hypothetical protein
MASTIAYETSSKALLRPAEDAVFFQGWDTKVDNLNYDLLCAEMSRLAYASEDVVRGALQDVGFTLLEYIGGDSLEQRVLSRGTQGFVAHNPKNNLTILAFRGTESNKVEDLFFDGSTLQKKWPNFKGCLVHEGFANCWGCVSNRLTQCLANRKGELLITGHSLGAAIATLAAIEIKPSLLITFGSPLVGNDKLAALLDPKKIRRYVNCCDLITRVPPERFDKKNITQLFAELAAIEGLPHLGAFFAKRAIQGIGAAISFMMHQLHLDPHFKHVAREIYIDRHGTIQRNITPKDRHRDQEAARHAYARSLTSPPFRDLADHTPLNYVSAFTGR